MKANELRIGNYILISVIQQDMSFKNEMFSVNANVIRDAEKYGNEWNAEPIPLTEEWLLKFGFKKVEMMFVNDSMRYFRKDKIIIASNEVFLMNEKEQEISIDCKYVHQLQNLYFALTGEELKTE